MVNTEYFIIILHFKSFPSFILGVPAPVIYIIGRETKNSNIPYLRTAPKLGMATPVSASAVNMYNQCHIHFREVV